MFTRLPFGLAQVSIGERVPRVTSIAVILRLMVLCVSTDSFSYLRSDPTLNTRGIKFLRTCPVHRWWLCSLLWTQIRGSFMVRAADCRSAGPWFNSGWMSWFIFVTRSDNLMNHPAQRYNIMSPIRILIITIRRKSVKMVAELDNDTAPSLILDTTDRLEDYSTVAKAATATAVAVDTKARAAQGTVVQLKIELVQSQQNRTEAKTQADSLSQ